MRTAPLLMSFLFALASAGSIAAPATPASAAPSNEELVWPKPPALVRIRYIRTVAGAADWGITPGIFARLVNAVTGATPIHFVRPTGVAERAKVLYIADPGAQALFILDAGQEEARQVTAAGNETLLSPVAVALGPAEQVFLADSVLKKIFVLDRNGKLVRTIANPALMRPGAVAYDPASDRLYVADSAAHRIAVFSGSGQLLQTFGSRGREDGQFNSPTHLALTRDGQLIVTDALNYRVQAFDGTGRFLWKLGHLGDGSGDFASPKGVAADSAGQVYVVDALFDAIQIFSRNGSLLLGFGERGTRPGRFWLPGGIFIDPQDTVYVADAYNQRIQVFQRVRADGAEGDQ